MARTADLVNLITNPVFGLEPVDTVFSGGGVVNNQERLAGVGNAYGFQGDDVYRAKFTANNVSNFGYFYTLGLFAGGGAAVVAGRRYGVRVRYRVLDRSVSGSLSFGFIVCDAAGNVLGDPGVTEARSWATTPLGMYETVLIGTMPANAAWLSPRLNIDAIPNAESVEIYVGDVMVVELPAGSIVYDIPQFFSGESDNASWSGTPHASVSLLHGTDAIIDSPVAQRIYDELAPLAYDDENQSFALARWVKAWTASLETLNYLVSDIPLPDGVRPNQFNWAPDPGAERGDAMNAIWGWNTQPTADDVNLSLTRELGARPGGHGKYFYRSKIITPANAITFRIDLEAYAGGGPLPHYWGGRALAGKTVRLVFWFRLPNSGELASAALVGSTTGGGSFNVSFGSQFATSAPNWQRYSATVDLPANVESIQLQLRCTQINPGEFFDIDDIMLVEQKEDVKVEWSLGDPYVARTRSRDMDTTNASTFEQTLPDNTPGWAVSLMPDLTPEIGLAWLRQFVGMTETRGRSEEAQRNDINDGVHLHRGSTRAISTAMQPYLRGLKQIGFQERYIGNPWRIEVSVSSDDAPETDNLFTNVLLNPTGRQATTGWAAFQADGVPSLTTTDDPDFGLGTGGMIYETLTPPTGTSTVYMPYAADGGPGTNMRAVTPGQRYGFRAKVKILRKFVNAPNPLRLSVRAWQADLITPPTGGQPDLFTTPKPLQDYNVGDIIVLTGSWVAPANAAFAGPQLIVGNIPGFSGKSVAGDFLMGIIALSTRDIVIPEYGDGNYSGWAWSGTPDNSTSVRTPTKLLETAARAQKPIGLRMRTVIAGVTVDP